MGCGKETASNDLLTVIERLYANEINFSIQAYWDEGVHVRLEDDLNGIVAEELFHPDQNKCLPLSAIGEWLLSAAREHFPMAKLWSPAVLAMPSKPN